MNIEIEIFRKFPCKLLEMKIQPKMKEGLQSIYIDLENTAKLYLTIEGDLIITDIKLKSGEIITLKNLVLRRYKLKDIRYKRTSNDYPNELFLHNFNGKEKFYTCNFKNNLIYFVRGKKPLYEVREEEKWL